MDFNLTIFDNHLHLRRDGLFLDAVKEFINAGGTDFVLCQYPMPQVVIKEKSYKNVYHHTLKMAEEIRQKFDVGVYVTVGPYPVDYLKLIEKFSREQTIEIMKKAMDEAFVLCEEKKIIGIGEIGRPHFPVEPQVVDDSNSILFYGMQKAKEADVPVILHTESTTPKNCKEFVELGKKAGLKPEKIVKHYSPPLIRDDENFGLMPSVLASKKNINTAVKKGFRFMMETDYIDDLRRPGAVLSPKTVPKRTKELLDKNLVSKEDLLIVHKENPEKTYGICLER